MESLSGKQITDIKDLYQSIYKSEEITEEFINEEDLNQFINLLTEEEKKNIFRRAFDAYMKGPSKNPIGSAFDFIKGLTKKKKKENVNINPNDKKKENVNINSTDNGKVDTNKVDTSNDKKTVIKTDNGKVDISKIDKIKTDNGKVNAITYVGSKETDINKIKTKPEVKKEVKPEVKTKVKDKLLSTHIPIVSKTELGSTVRPVKPGSARDKMIARNELRHGSDHIVGLRNKNADFQRMKKGEITKADFMKQYPNSQTAKKFKMKALESYEPYDLVLNYVLSEGHASTLEEAHYVMMQMNQDTIQTIVSEYENV